MQYCPKCKTEYEEHASICADCQIELVGSLEEAVYMKELVKVKTEELDEMLDYLNYSNIVKREIVQEEGFCIIKVPEEDYAQALEYLKVYVHEHMEEDHEQDYYFDEYTTEVVDLENKVSDMKSSIYTFGVVGGGLVLVSILNYLDIIVIKGFDKGMLTLVLASLGLIFCLIAIKTYRGLDKARDEGSAKEALLAEMLEAYTSKYDPTAFDKRYDLNLDTLDEGAKYFAVFDLMKKELGTMYPEVEDQLINTVVERVYNTMDESSSN